MKRPFSNFLRFRVRKRSSPLIREQSGSCKTESNLNQNQSHPKRNSRQMRRNEVSIPSLSWDDQFENDGTLLGLLSYSSTRRMLRFRISIPTKTPTRLPDGFWEGFMPHHHQPNHSSLSQPD